MQVSVNYLGEGASDEAIARRLIVAAGGVVGKSYLNPLVGTGKQSLDARLPGLNNGARYGPLILILRDLDNDAACAPELLSKLLPDRHPRLVLRVCVRSAEAWLMADATAYARYCGLRVGQMPGDAEDWSDLKQRLVEFANSGSAPKLQRHLAETARRRIAPYRALGKWHSDFASEHWNPDRAAASGRAPSLNRALNRLRALIREG